MANGNTTRKKKQMPKRKNGNGGPKPPKPVSQFLQPKTLSIQRVPRGPVLKGHHKQTCSLLDPFCVHARGAKLLDGMGGNTLSVPLKGLATILAASTSGRARWTFIPSMLYYAGEATGGGLPTSWTNPTSWKSAPYSNSLLSTFAKEIRIVNFGIMFRSAMTASTAKGNVIVTVETQPGVNDTGLVPPGAILGESQVKTLAAGTEFAWVSKPLGPSATLMKPLSTYTSTQTDFDWTSCVVEIVGGDTTDVTPFLTAELFMNVEFTVATTMPGAGVNNGLSQLLTAPPPPNPTAVLAARRAQSTQPSFIDGVLTTVSNKLSSYAMDALQDIGTAVLAAF